MLVTAHSTHSKRKSLPCRDLCVSKIPVIWCVVIQACVGVSFISRMSDCDSSPLPLEHVNTLAKRDING